MANILLITGRPGVGKTTLIQMLAETLGDRAGGFYTEEIRESGERVGFRLVTLDGRSAVFAHTAWKSRTPHRVGRYGVDTDALDGIGLDTIRRAAAARQVVLIDEIGRMELLSTRFREVLDQIAQGPVQIVATITVASHPWSDAFKARPGVTLLELTRANHDQILAQAQAWLATRSRSARGR